VLDSVRKLVSLFPCLIADDLFPFHITGPASLNLLRKTEKVFKELSSFVPRFGQNYKYRSEKICWLVIQ
ncbi:MAG: hypothetical protein M3530_01580, partial [Thermoproteota archaeon]|nr:hypothetical protein [Thermoproteota archaeon]